MYHIAKGAKRQHQRWRWRQVRLGSNRWNVIFEIHFYDPICITMPLSNGCHLRLFHYVCAEDIDMLDLVQTMCTPRICEKVGSWLSLHLFLWDTDFSKCNEKVNTRNANVKCVKLTVSHSCTGCLRANEYAYVSKCYRLFQVFSLSFTSRWKHSGTRRCAAAAWGPKRKKKKTKLKNVLSWFMTSAYGIPSCLALNCFRVHSSLYQVANLRARFFCLSFSLPTSDLS